MSDLVRNPGDWFSHFAAHLSDISIYPSDMAAQAIWSLDNTRDRFSPDKTQYELRIEKTCDGGFRPGHTQTRLCSDRRWLAA